MLGVVFLTGIVFVAGLLVVGFGSVVVQDFQGELDRQTVQLSLQNVDERLSSLADAQDVPRTSFRLPKAESGDVAVRRHGTFTVVANENTTCSSTTPLSSIRYETSDGQIVAYEAGGIWQSSGRGGSALVSPPDVNFENKTLSAQILNISGNVSETETDAILNVSGSRHHTAETDQRIFQDTCKRPNNLTVKVESDFYQAWGNYMAGEFGTDVRVFDYNTTALAFVPQDRLPRRTDDEHNDVIDLSGAPYMDQADVTGATILVDKPGSKKLSGSFEPMDFPLDISSLYEVEGASKVKRLPIDVIFAIDESGSMQRGNGHSLSHCQTAPPSCQPDRLKNSQQASKQFVAKLNHSKDMAGVVGFNHTARYPLTDNEKRLTGNFNSDGVNSSLDDLDHKGGTHINEGVKKIREVLELQSSQSRDQIAVLLTDGKNNPSTLNEPTEQQALKAAESDITIYTIGYADSRSEINETLMKYIAHNTSGEYYFVQNQYELEDVFDEIITKITSTRQITHRPLTTNVSTESGRLYEPTVSSLTGQLAKDTINGETFYNVNDPLLNTPFRNTFYVADGKRLLLNASYYDCSAWQGTPHRRTNDSNVFQVTRCGTLDPSSRVQVPETDTTVYLDGADVSPILTNTSAWWQTNMTNTLEPHLDSSEHLDLNSNEAVVVFQFPNGDKSDNRLAMRFEIGASEEESVAKSVVNVEVRDVTLDS